MLTHIVQVKIPVTDLVASARWYAALLRLELAIEFVEDGIVRGVSLVAQDGPFRVSLREREVCESRPVLDGFDPFSIAVDSDQALRDLAERCDELGVVRGEIQDRGEFGSALDVPDPDGTVLRVLWEPLDYRGRFVGFELGAGPPRVYDEPRLEGNW